MRMAHLFGMALEGARVRGEMGAAGSVKADALPNVCQRKVVKTNPTGAKTECLLLIALPSWSRISWRLSFALVTNCFSFGA